MANIPVYTRFKKIKGVLKTPFILKMLFYAPNPPTPPPPTNNAPKPHNGKGAKVGILGTHKAKAKFNFRNTRWEELLGARI